MAQPYFDRLTAKLREADLSKRGVVLECRHFFSGAALYANDKIFASLTPAGLAVFIDALTLGNGPRMRI